MILTEAEAKEKWCPQARRVHGSFHDSGIWTIDTNEAATNLIKRRASANGKYKEDMLLVKCIGSGCMAWRWAEGQDYEVPMTGEVEQRKGYCGAYGKPDRA